MKARKYFWIGSLAALVLASVGRAAEPVAAQEYRQLLAAIKPHAGEDQWAEIPWAASLWQARQKAAKEGKPILLWEMDGHPLGCV